MYRIIIVSILFLFAIAYSPVIAKRPVEKVKHAKKSALILKDSSNLEVSVSRIIQDTLTKSGYKVKEIHLADVSKEKASSYTISILFSAVNKGDEVDTRIQNYIASKVDTTSKVYLYNVYGNIYNKKDENVDAKTQASIDLHPDLIAAQIIRSLKL
jgi:hypothetical protein